MPHYQLRFAAVNGQFHRKPQRNVTSTLKNVIRNLANTQIGHVVRGSSALLQDNTNHYCARKETVQTIIQGRTRTNEIVARSLCFQVLTSTLMSAML